MKETTLRKRLRAKRLKAARIAAPCGVSSGHMAAIFNGSRRPSPELAAKIESITGIPLRVLLGLESSPAESPEVAEKRDVRQ